MLFTISAFILLCVQEYLLYIPCKIDSLIHNENSSKRSDTILIMLTSASDKWDLKKLVCCHRVYLNNKVSLKKIYIYVL